MSQQNHKPTSVTYFEKRYGNLPWKDIFVLPRLAAHDTKMRNFQYKILNNVLYLNKKLFQFGLVDSSLCPFCKRNEETIVHLFLECEITKTLWFEIVEFFKISLKIPAMTEKNAIFGFHEVNKDLLLVNHILLIFKFYIYKARGSGTIDLFRFISHIKSIKKIEISIFSNNDKKGSFYMKKWQLLDNLV